MTTFGKGLLENSICYIARFTEDRPMVKSSASIRKDWMRARSIADRLVTRTGYEKSIPGLFDASVRAHFDPSKVDEFRAWYRRNRGFLYPSKANTKQLSLDPDLVAFGTSYDHESFLPKLIEAIDEMSPAKESSASTRARRLLARFVDEPLDHEATQAEWSGWWQENRDSLFFSDGGYFRFYVDKLSRARGVPSVALRGVARATRPAFKLQRPALRRVESGPVRIEAKFVREEQDPTKGSFELHFALEPNWHIYNTKLTENTPYTPTKLTLRLPTGANAMGEWTYPRAVASPHERGLTYFEGAFVFRREVRLAKDYTGDALRCKVAFMACDPDMCREPEEIEVGVR